MPSAIQPAAVHAPEDIRRELSRLVRSVAQDVASDSRTPAFKISRVELRVDGIEPLLWLAAQEHPVKGYWSDRGSDWEVAAIGKADVIKDPESLDYEHFFDQARDRLTGCGDNIRYYGGFRFGPWHAGDPSWRPFGSYRFILPQVEVARRGSETTIACNMISHGAGSELEETLALIERLSSPGAAMSGRLPSPLGRMDDPALPGWQRNVERVLHRIDQGDLEKLVLARRTCFEFPQTLNAFGLLHRLKVGTPGCFHFCGSHGGNIAFMGASPERLYRRKGTCIWSEAVAGTRPRGKTPETDERLGTDLRQSSKDVREQRLVLDGIRESLEPLCVSLQTDATVDVLRLATVQHLVSSIEGQLKPGVGDADILRRLHPTPAVGGRPTAPALEEMARLESFDRGWYAAPVGWVGRDEAEFAVAIRCGVIAGSRLCLFSGAGIVRGSKPQDEWNEVESKISDFMEVLTGT